MKLEVISSSVSAGTSSDSYTFGTAVGCLYTLLHPVAHLGHYDEMHASFSWKPTAEYLEFELSCVMKIVRIVQL